MAWSESALWMCPSCGTSNVQGTRYCERCRLPLVPPPPPLSVPVNSSPAPATPPAVPSSLDRRRKARRRSGYGPLWFAIGVVAVLVLAVILLGRFAPQSVRLPGPPAPGNNTSQYSVVVLSVLYQPNACWNDSSGPGFHVPGGAPVEAKLSLSNSMTFTCVVNVASAQTSGFSIASQNTPLEILPHQSGTLNLTIQTPNFDVDQSIIIGLTVSELK
jgi:hypothetical protein